MKLQWLKEILGDAYTEEIDAKTAAALGERFVSRADFNAKNDKVKELETASARLREEIRNRDAQLEGLRQSAGDNAELQKQIDALTRQNKEQKAAYDKELEQVRLTGAVDAELTAAGARNNTAVKAILAEFLGEAKVVDGKVTGKVDGAAVTLAARIEEMKRDTSTDFLFRPSRQPPAGMSWKPGEGSDGARTGKEPSEMSYAELADYLAKNPGADLE